MLRGSGFSEIVIEARIYASGSIEKVMSGKHYNRALRVHKIVMEAMERLLLLMFQSKHPEHVLDKEAVQIMEKLVEHPTASTLETVKRNTAILKMFEHYSAFKASISQ